MVATRAQRAHTKDEPAASQTSALKQPARRGKKVAIEEPVPKSKAPEPKMRSAAPKPKQQTIAPVTRRTRAKDAEAQISEQQDVKEPEKKVQSQPASATTTTKRTVAKPATKSATATISTTRKRPAKESEPERAPPPKRQTRSRTTAPSAMKVEKKVAPARRTTRAAGDEEQPCATVKPLAQRIKVTSNETKTATRTEQTPQSDNDDDDVHMEGADSTPAPLDTVQGTAELQNLDEADHQDVGQEPKRKKGAKTPKSTRKGKNQEKEQVPTTTPTPARDNAAEEIVEEAQETRPKTPKTKETQKEAHPSAIPVETPRDKSATPVRYTGHVEAILASEKSGPLKRIRNLHTKQATPGTEQQVKERCLSTKENVPPQTPALAQLAQALPFADAATPFFNPGAQTKTSSATPAPSRLAHALPFANVATPFFRPDQAPKTHSLQAATPAFKKSTLLSGTPRRDPVASPFKLAPKSAVKSNRTAPSSEALLHSPPKKGPMVASALGMTPMKATTPRSDFKTSLLQTPARKGLMLPPSTAPVNKHGPASVPSKSSLLQTCPRRIALPDLAPRSATIYEKQGEKMGSSLFSATPRKVRLDAPPAETSVQDFPRQSVLGGTPKRPKTPARSPTRRFATPGEAPEKSLVDADAGSPTPVKPTPAGLKDVDSALRMLNDDRDASMLSPSMRANTPTEQFMMNVIEKLDLDIEEQSQSFKRQSTASSGDQSPAFRVPRHFDANEAEAEEAECDAQDEAIAVDTHQPPVEEDSMVDDTQEVPRLETVPSFVEPEITMIQHHLEKTLGTVDEHFEGNVDSALAVQELDSATHQLPQATEELAPRRREMEMIAEEPSFFTNDQEASVLGEVDSPVKVHLEVAPDQPIEEQPLERMEEPRPVSFHMPERPSTPEITEERITSLAKQKAKTEHRARSKRLSLAIELESSIKKPRKSLAFVPSMTPMKSALRSPFKKSFGSPKKSVAFAAEPVFQQQEIIEQPEETYIPRPDFGLLSGMTFFVDVRSASGEDAGDLFVPLLEEMGAKVVYDWNDGDSNVTHILFKDGSNETLHRVAQYDGAVQAVNIGWALDCERFNQRLPESPYLIDISLSPSHRPHTPSRALTVLSTNTTPTRSTGKATPHGTPFALLHLTPKAAPSPSTRSPISPSLADIASPTLDARSEKENRGISTPSPAHKSAVQMEPFSPSTPYYLHPERITQKTCPPKQTQRGIFDQRVNGNEDEGFVVTPFARRLLLARRSLSPVKATGGLGSGGAAEV